MDGQVDAKRKQKVFFIGNSLYPMSVSEPYSKSKILKDILFC